ncbi:MAG: hypothetical protein R3E87_14950 [Burkholderiaceae bacterium]
MEEGFSGVSGHESKIELLTLCTVGVQSLQDLIYTENVRIGWWERDGKNTSPGDPMRDPYRVVPEKIALIHSEVSEALEGYRTSAMDKHLPHHSSIAVGLADAVIRILDLAGAMNVDLAPVIIEKVAYNWQRQDHTREARAQAGGKKI